MRQAKEAQCGEAGDGCGSDGVLGAGKFFPREDSVGEASVRNQDDAPGTFLFADDSTII